MNPMKILLTTLFVTLAASASAAPGLLFRETMPGHLAWGSSEYVRQSSSQKAAIRLTITADDADAFFADPNHPMRLKGFFDVTSPDGLRLRYTIEDGTFLCQAPGDGPDEARMVYRFSFRDEQDRRFWFRGVKTMRNDPGFDAIQDTTTLYSSIHRGSPDGPVLAAGKLRFQFERPWVMARFLASFRVPGAHGLRQRIRVIRRFVKLYLGTMANTYRRGRSRWRWRR